PRQRRVLQRPVPEVAVLDRLLGLAELPLPGRSRKPAELTVQRVALAGYGRPEVPLPLQAGPRHRRQEEADADPARHAEDGVQQRRLPDLGLLDAPRRLQ